MDSEDIPEMIASNKQSQLIFFTGLDIANNKSHAAVFSAFTVHRERDRPPLRCIILNSTHTLRERKKQQLAVPISPRGFIKVDWLNKYVNEMPAVIVLFADLGWDHPSWNEKVTECESKISSLRTSIGRCATRICVVLLQQTLTTDNSMATERASKLCQICQLPTKHLFVLLVGERMFESVLRLEIAFHELAQGFYQQCLKSVRAKSIPNNFSNLIIRQQFKLAFISELRQDTHTALRHYKLAYQHCTECEVIDSEIYELRTVAGLLNYKICQLSFLHSTALEAVAQQRRHNTIFFCLDPGSYPSPAIASIEHILWKGKQCFLFANLFEQAVVDGLVAVSTQHPGLYLQAAAYYYRQANEAIAVLKVPVRSESTYPSPDPLAPTKLIFYGQRPWRAAVENGNLADLNTEKNACLALEMRCLPNHDRCLALLSSAMSQFKKYKCSRTQRYMMLLLSEEYTATGQYAKALQFSSHLLWECRREGFIPPVAMLYLRALDCAFRVADVKEFITLSIQMLNLRTFPCFASIADQIMTNIALIRKGFPPHMILSDVNISQVEACQKLWSTVFAERVFFSISAPSIGAFIRARIAFLTSGTETIYAGTSIFLMVALSSYATKPMLFEKLKVTINEDKLSERAEQPPLYEFIEENVEISPAKETVKIYRLPLPHSSCAVAKHLVISGLSLEMGFVHSSVYGTIDWDAESLSYGTYDNTYASSILDACIGCTTLTIEPREANFRIEKIDQSETLLGEITTIPLSLVCEESGLIRSVRLDWSWDVKAGLFFINEQNQFLSNDSEVFEYDNPRTSPFKVELSIRCCAQIVCSANILVMISVVVDDVIAQKHFLIPLCSRLPFEINTKILSMNNEVIESPFAEATLFARTDITTVANIVVSNISWKPSSEVEISEKDQTLLNEELSYVEDDIFTVCVPLRFPNKTEDRRCNLGEICIRWRRSGSLQGWVLSQLSAGSVLVRNSPVSIKVQILTSNLAVRTAIPIIFSVQNLHKKVIDLQMTLESADMFMFAGNKKGCGFEAKSSQLYDISWYIHV